MNCKLQRLVRRLSRWAWEDFLFNVGRVEWKYGRTEEGPKDWTEWDDVRDTLSELERLRAPHELDKQNAPMTGGERSRHDYE